MDLGLHVEHVVLCSSGLEKVCCVDHGCTAGVFYNISSLCVCTVLVK